MLDIRLSNGNIKVDALIFNLPCFVTCKSGLECRKYCYARKAEIQYHHVVPQARQANLDASKDPSFVQDMIKILSKKRKNTVRIHESGDFYSVEYFNKWVEIAEAFPEKTFYAYTKRNDLLMYYHTLLKPDNFILIFSIDGIQDKKPCSIPKGYDSVAYVHATESNCPAQLNKDIKCGKQCRKCMKSGQTICFSKH